MIDDGTENNDLGMKCYMLYQQSLKNIQSDAPHLEDEVIVALWRLVMLQKKQLAEQYHLIDLLESKNTKLEGIIQNELARVKEVGNA